MPILKFYNKMGKNLNDEEFPLISVIIPMYNRERSIVRCVNSVLSQSYTNLEILVVDDASTDNSVSIVNSVKDKRLRVLTSDIKIFAQGARNLGVKNAKGNWIVFLDSDDELTQDSILNRYRVLKKYPDADFIYGDIVNIECFKNLNTATQQEFQKYIFRELSLCAFSEIMVKKSCIEKIGYLDEKYKAWQDDSFVVSSIKKGFILKHSGGNVSKHHSDDNQITSNYKNLYQGVSRIVNTYKNDIIQTNGYYRYFLWQLRILLNYLGTKKNTRINRLIKSCLRKFLLTKFEHIFG
jgi:glycosyltransferase involved in cell wall biosynthesis